MSERYTSFEHGGEVFQSFARSTKHRFQRHQYQGGSGESRRMCSASSSSDRERLTADDSKRSGQRHRLAAEQAASGQPRCKKGCDQAL